MNISLKVEKIKESISQEAGMKISAINDSIKEEVSKKEIEGKKKIDSEFQSLMESEKNRILLNQKRNLSKAILTEKNRKMHVEAELIEQAFGYIRTKLEDLRSQKDYYKDILKALIVEAVKFMKDDKLVIQTDERDKDIVTDDFLSSIEIIFTFNENRSVRFKISDKFIMTLGGIILTADGKRVYCDNTFEERLEVEAPLIKRIIAEMLLKEGV